jgi:dephospho-CoA kinase
MFRLGLTGGIGSGKSAVADILASFGAAIIDTDVIAHEITAPHGLAIDAIRNTFGASFIKDDNSLDRTRMREEVFNHPESRKKLEQITHPLISQVVNSKSQAIIDSGLAPYIVYVVPLLVESEKWINQSPPRIDGLLVIDCPKDAQIDRVKKRNHLETDLIEKIISSQASREERLKHADWVIQNDSNLEHLENQTRQIHQEILKKISQK